MTNLLEFPKLICVIISQKVCIVVQNMKQKKMCKFFHLKPKKVNAKNLLLRLDFDENQTRYSIMKFVYRCEFSIWM